MARDTGRRAARATVGVALAVLATLVVLGGLAVAPAVPTSSHLTDLATSFGKVYVHSSSWAVNTGPNTTTPAISIVNGSELFVFIGYINGQIGGGSIMSVTDSASIALHKLTGTGFITNHTEVVYTANNVLARAALTVTVWVTGGATNEGGSVAVVDVVGQAASHPINVTHASSGKRGSALIPILGHNASDFFLVGLSGQAKDCPFNGGVFHEHLILNGNGTGGPWADGESVGVFTHAPQSGATLLGADLNQTADWAGVAVGILP
jgi:hypothetical protein